MCPDPVFAMWPHRFPGASGPGRPLAVGAACCCLWHRWCSGRLRARPPGARRRRVRGGVPGPCVCYLVPQVSGRLRARPPARSPHASLRLGVVDLEARPCPPDPPAPSTPVGSRRPPTGRYLVCMYLARPCRHPRASQPCPPALSTPVGSRRSPIGRYLVCMYLARPCRHPRAPQPCPPAPSAPVGSRRPAIGRSLVRPGCPPGRCLSLGAPRAPGAWPARRKATSRRSGSPAPPTRRPSRSSGTSERSRGR